MATLNQKMRGFGNVNASGCDFFRRCSPANPTAKNSIQAATQVESDCKCKDGKPSDFWMWVAILLGAFILTEKKK